MKKLLLVTLAPLFVFASTPIDVKFLNDENSQDGKVVLSITNNSKKDIEVLKWNTPLEKRLSADMFNVKIGQKDADYTGRLIKRGKATDNDYVLLESGVSEKITIDLSKYYEMKKKGNYSVEFDGSFKYRILDTKEVKEEQLKKSEIPKTILFFVPTPQQKRALALKQTANFNGCSQNDIKVLKLAHNDAITMSKEASQKMNSAGKKTSAERYVTWFGKADEKRQKIVTDAYNKIYDAFENKDVAFDCGTCKSDEEYDEVFAYVHPNQHYKIYLCGAFWKSSRTGTDTQGGTLIHEASHFAVIANTNDYAYGQTDAKALAKNSPNKAVNNAENYDYFAENNPKLSMENGNGGDDNSDDNTDNPTNDGGDNNGDENSSDSNNNGITDEDRDWNKCIALVDDNKIDECLVKWEEKYYPYDNDDWSWDDESYDDELNWDDIDWGYYN